MRNQGISAILDKVAKDLRQSHETHESHGYVLTARFFPYEVCDQNSIYKNLFRFKQV